MTGREENALRRMPWGDRFVPFFPSHVLDPCTRVLHIKTCNETRSSLPATSYPSLFTHKDMHTRYVDTEGTKHCVCMNIGSVLNRLSPVQGKYTVIYAHTAVLVWRDKWWHVPLWATMALKGGGAFIIGQIRICIMTWNTSMSQSASVGVLRHICIYL